MLTLWYPLADDQPAAEGAMAVLPSAVHRLSGEAGARFTTPPGEDGELLAAAGCPSVSVAAALVHRPGRARLLLDGDSDRRLGVEIHVTPRRDMLVLSAVRPGIAAGDDELVARLFSWDDGCEWVVVPEASPRHQVVMALLRSLHTSRDPATAAVPRRRRTRVGTVVDDAALLEDVLGMEGWHADADRARVWTSDEDPVHAILDLADAPDRDGHRLRLVRHGEGELGDVIVGAGGTVTWHPGGVDPTQLPRPLGDLPSSVQHLARQVSATVTEASRGG